MEWSERQILDTLRFIEESDYDEVSLETNGFKLHVRKSGLPTPSATLAAARGARPPAPQPQPASAVAPAAERIARNAAEVRVVPPGMVAIRAPMIGTFYRAPAPHLPPFVEEGADVRPEDTVCMIEVMKLFNTLKAGVAGKVVKIFAQNAAPVSKDQVLLIIEPAP